MTDAATSPLFIPSTTAEVSSTVSTPIRLPLSRTASRPPAMPPALKYMRLGTSSEESISFTIAVSAREPLRETLHALTVTESVERARNHGHFAAVREHQRGKVAAHIAALHIIAADVGEFFVKAQVVVESDDGHCQGIEFGDDALGIYRSQRTGCGNN